MLARRLGRSLARIAAAIAVFGLLAVGVLMFFEEHLVFVPSRYPEGDWQPAGLEVEDAWFAASDGTKLHGWYVESPNPRAVVLFCHGNAGNVTHRTDLLRGMREVVGASTLVFDYRGYGRSEGSPDEAGVMADARAARAWLAQRSGVSEKEIVVMGESLGGAVAVDLAANDGARGLILENTFDALPEVAAHHFHWLPVRWLMRTRLNSAEKIRRYHGPLLQTHAGRDTIVPYACGQRLFEAANEPKQFVVCSGRDHNDPRRSEDFDRVRTFLDSLPSP